MDFNKQTTIADIDKIMDLTGFMCERLKATRRWSIKGYTVYASLAINNKIVWRESYIGVYPHNRITAMCYGVYNQVKTMYEAKFNARTRATHKEEWEMEQRINKGITR